MANNDEKMLLVETWDNPVLETLVESTDQSGNQQLVPLNEAIDKGPGKLYIRGIFMQAEVKNRNGRIYPKPVLEPAVDKYIKNVVNTKQALGETNHPPRPNVDPDRASILIEKLWWEGNNVLGIAKVIEGDGGPGDKLAANIRAGWVPGLSSRGLGSVKNDPVRKAMVVNEGYTINVAADVVWGPSAPDAYGSSYIQSESCESSANSITEATNTNDDEAFKQLIEQLSKIN